MNINEIISVEMEGVSKTIFESTTDNYIRSYAKQLLKISYPSDKGKLLILLGKLSEWYDEKLSEMNTTEFPFNLKNHKYSNVVIKKLQELIHNESNEELE